jgi:hypothetical protein
MRSRLVLALFLACATPVLQAQEAAEPRVERRVLEDEGVRIEELRVRGQTQRIVVQPKKGVLRAYEVLPLEGGRDPSQTRNGQPGAAGKRVWNILSF